MNFGKYAILTPVVHTFEKEPQWSWTIKPVTTREELLLSQFLNAERVAVLPDGARIGRPATNNDVMIEEVALTFGGTNIPDDKGNPILKSDASLDEVKALLLNMPQEMVVEIWKAVGEAVPGWGPVQPKKKVSSEAPSA